MSLISAIREFFLGPPLQFHHQKTIIETIYAQLNNLRFAYLLIIVSIISFLALIIRISRLNKQTGILPFVVCAILIYSGYCLERSFRVGVDMDAENLLKDLLTNSIRKSSLIKSLLYDGKMPISINMPFLSKNNSANNEKFKEQKPAEPNTEEDNDQNSLDSDPQNDQNPYGNNTKKSNEQITENSNDLGNIQLNEKNSKSNGSNDIQLNEKNSKSNGPNDIQLNEKNSKSNGPNDIQSNEKNSEKPINFNDKELIEQNNENLNSSNDRLPREQTTENSNDRNDEVQLNEQNSGKPNSLNDKELSEEKFNGSIREKHPQKDNHNPNERPGNQYEDFNTKEDSQSSSESPKNKNRHLITADSHAETPSIGTDLVQTDNPNEKSKKTVEIKVVRPESKKHNAVLKRSPNKKEKSEDIPDPYLPTAEESTSTPNELEKIKEKKMVFDDTFEQKDFLKKLKKTINKKESAILKAKALLTDLKKTGNFIREDLEKFEENFNQFLKNSTLYKNILIKADISPDLYKIDLEDLKEEVGSRLEIILLLEKFIKVSRNGKTGLFDKMKSAFSPDPEWQPLISHHNDQNSQKELFHNNLRNISQDMRLLNDSEDQNIEMRNKNKLIDPVEVGNENMSELKEEMPSNLTNPYGQRLPGTTDFLLQNNFLAPFPNRVYLTEKAANDQKQTEGNRDKTNFDLQETENLKFIQAFMVIQGVVCLVIFILMICNLLNIIPACKLLLLVILIGNVFIGIVSMIYAQALAKRCIIMDVPNCQNRNLFDVEEVVDILNEREEPKTENAISFIETKFKENYDDLSISVEKLENYMKGNESKAIHKIDVFRNMINKLMFIESDFEPTSKFFSPIYTMKRYLEDLKHQLLLISNKSVFPIYRQILEAEIFFDDHKETISSRIENFLKLNMKRKEEKANDNCKKEMKKICKARKDYDQLAFALVVFGLIFVILVCF